MKRASLMAACTLGLAACLLSCGCGGDGGGGPGSDGGGNNGGVDLTSFPKACTGSLSGAIAGSFGCMLSMSNQPGEQDLNLAPMAFIGDSPKQLLLLLVTPGAFKAKQYALTDLAGTTLTVTNKLSATYSAANDCAGAMRGAVTFTVATPPSPPPGADSWVDTAMHGTLDATLPLDPNTPGTPWTTVTAHVTF